METGLFRSLFTCRNHQRPVATEGGEGYEEFRHSSLERRIWFCDSTEPAIILKNHSSYQVSYWVIQEDTLRTTAMTETISRQMGAFLEVSGGAVTGTLGASAARDTEIIREQDQDGYVRMADHRVGREGTTMPFPKNCDELRVLGYFRRNSSQAWRRFKNKVYSISRFRKIITLVATDGVIGMYLEQEEAKDQTGLNDETKI